MVQIRTIAELGINHDGNMKKARDMILSAKGIGANYVKLQYYHVEELGITDPVLHEKVASCALNLEQIAELRELSEHEGLGFICTAMGTRRTLDEYVQALHPPLLKVREADGRKTEFLKALLDYGLPALISVDPSKGLTAKASDKWYFLFCIPKYPPMPSDLDAESLRAAVMSFDGFSSHYPYGYIPMEVCRVAKYSAKNVFWLECHVRLDDDVGCVDFPVSLTFSDFERVCSYAHHTSR